MITVCFEFYRHTQARKTGASHVRICYQKILDRVLTCVVCILDRLLMPAFSTAKVRDMFDDMVDISQQMIQKWERCPAFFAVCA